MRVELLLEPAIEAHAGDGSNIAGTGAEGEAIEGVEGAFLLGEWGGAVAVGWREAGFCGRGLCGEGGVEESGAERESQGGAE